MAEKTKTEEEVLRQSLRLIDAKFAIKEALIKQDWIRAVRQLQKERRDRVEKDEDRSTLQVPCHE